MRSIALLRPALLALGAGCLFGCGSAALHGSAEDASSGQGSSPSLAATTTTSGWAVSAGTTTLAPLPTTTMSAAISDPASIVTTTSPPGYTSTKATLAYVAMNSPRATVTPDWAETGEPPAVRIRVGDTLAFIAPADPTVLHGDGSIYSPLPPDGGAAGLLSEVRYTDPCPEHATCAAWVAVHAGNTVINESGPDGEVCGRVPDTQELECGMVDAAWWAQDVVVESADPCDQESPTFATQTFTITVDVT